MTMRVYCPVCDSITSFSKRVYTCGRCGHRYRIVEEDPIEFHRTKFRASHQRVVGEIGADGLTEAFHQSRQSITEERIKLIKRFLRRSDTVLDVGGGAGTFAGKLKEHVASVSVTEVNEVLVEACRDQGITAHQVAVQDMSEDEVYDVVFAWHVLEHCEPLQPAVTKLKRIFRRFLILEIPKERGAPEEFDGHYHFFSDESFQMLFSDLVVRFYVEGVQRPSRLAVFEKKRVATRLYQQWEKNSASRQLDHLVSGD